MAFSRIFPFARCTRLTSLALESENLSAAANPDGLNDLIQDALRHTFCTLKSLILRSATFVLLNPSSIHAILRTYHLQYLLLDGSVFLDGRDWILLSKSLDLHIVARIFSWIPVEVRRRNR
jgi:hypothetical protein